jgi:hypothetical protein
MEHKSTQTESIICSGAEDQLLNQSTKQVIMKLKEHLAISKIDHKQSILSEPTLKDAHVYCLINKLSAQQYGPLLEKFICEKFSFIKNSATEAMGDCQKNGKNVEIKVSLGGDKNCKYNYVQIRPNHDCDEYLFTAYHLSDENVEEQGQLYIFQVSKLDLLSIICEYGGYAHGTVKKNGKITFESMTNDKNDKEYAIRPKYGDKCWTVLSKYRISEYEL